MPKNNTPSISANTPSSSDQSSQKGNSTRQKDYLSTVTLQARGYINTIVKNGSDEKPTYFVKCSLQMGTKEGTPQYLYVSVLVGRELVHFIGNHFEGQVTDVHGKATSALSGQNYLLSFSNVDLSTYDAANGSVVVCDGILTNVGMADFR